MSAAICAFAGQGVLSAQATPDFLFGTPRVTVGLRAGYAVPAMTSEVFDFTSELLTVERHDFHSGTWAAQLAVRLTPRLDVALDVGFAGSRAQSHFRDFVDTDDLEIRQATEFQRIPATLGLKLFLLSRGRAVGRLAWIPEAWSPFVGGALGWVWYRFEQDGEFVDFETYDIFRDHFVSKGSSPTVHAFSGVEYSLSRSFLLSLEGRYSWAKGEMGPDFVDFDDIDLSGVQGTVGIAVRF